MRVCILSVLIFQLLINIGFGQNILVDSSFGVDGKFTYQIRGQGFPTSFDQFGDNIVINNFYQNSLHLGQFSSVLVSKNGSLKTEFGINGFSFDSLEKNHIGTEIELRSDSSFLITGGVEYNGSGAIIVGKFLPSGKLDTLFSNKGYFIASYGTISQGLLTLTDKNDNIYIAGASENFMSEEYPVLIKLSGNGTYDTSFQYKYGSLEWEKNLRLTKMILLPSGELLILGIRNNYFDDTKLILFKLNSDGLIDQEFGVEGKVELPLNSIDQYPTDLKILSNNQFLVSVVLNRPNDLNASFSNIYRFKADGTLDSSFCEECPSPGKSTIPENIVLNLMIMKDFIICGGSRSDVDGNYSRLIIDRLTSNGILDHNFHDLNSSLFNSMSQYKIPSKYVLQDSNRIILLYSDNYSMDSFDGNLLAFKIDNSISNKKLESAIDEITLYPNPATDVLYLTFDTKTTLPTTAVVKIYSVEGKLIQTQNCHSDGTQLKVELKGLPTGNYLGSVILDSSMKSFKFSKI